MGYRIEEVDTRDAPEALLREMHQHYVGHDAELLPDDPPEPFEQRVADWRRVPEHHLIPRWVLREDGEIVAVAVVFMNKYEDLDNGFARIHVRPDRRGRGLARMLATPVFDVLEANDRRLLVTDVLDNVPWEAWLAQLGLKKSLVEKRSRLSIADLDIALMDQWIRRAAERAADYDILHLDSPIPEEHLGRWCEVQHVMHTAPKEDLEFEYETWTPAKWRENEAKQAEAGNRLVACVAVHRESGEFVGLTDMVIQRHQPDLAWQGDTGVHPNHRNKGLGRWLKAALIRRVVEEHPEIERVDTFNAGSNRAMLNINVEMGYRPILVTNAWQGELAVVRERLGA